MRPFTRKGPLLAAAALALMVAGCSSKPAPMVATAVPSAALGPTTAAAFVAIASSAALYAVKAAELAEARSADSEVRALATLQRENAMGIAGQLSFAGRRLNLLPSAELLPEHEALLRKLQYASDFDRTYIEQQRTFVPDVLDLHRTYAARGESPTLRPVAELGADLLENQVEAIDDAD
ncbi:DUF4142 domain-containing protein [Sphingomicrobium nitratireducens]|uniref:DUF4142 domain-containing protein n=1 Tax=Sphingomicrobium nitratireducens TaxID=2964666 RepID=UPI002240718D|nr:DUF4142 domain-containing protein [Sphingomicrobium nitratireducens]